MARILVIVASGPKSDLRAREGFSMARAIHEMGMAESVLILLTGEGVRALSPTEEGDLHEHLRAVIEAGVPVAACTRSLEEQGQLDAIDEEQTVQPVGAPVFLAGKADEGYVMLTF